MAIVDWHQIFVESEPGILYWRNDRIVKKGKMITAFANTVAGYLHKRDNRWQIHYNNKVYTRSRIIWMMHNGPISKGLEIDHIDRNPLNDNITNLRLATKSENNWNKPKPKNNTSGLKGVCKYKPTNKWMAYIKVFGKSKTLGYFTTKEEAHAAYVNAAKAFHGEFACY
jgi:hypothetical protein